MQSCNVVDVFHQWSIITCVWERGKERKKEQSTTCSKQRAWERKKQLQLDQSKGEGREWDGNQERSNGERERDKQTNKREEWLKLEEDLSLFSHYAHVRALLPLYHIR